ncbi:MAG: class I SAM-dependent methyltransferase, partial [Chloroflexi bacterium]|nr:class I SAM-dependent methyltransferase [Chloroflexota bacterium]
MPDPNRPALSPHLYTEEYFREACEGYDEFNETNGARLSRRLQAAFAVAQVTRGMRVLDVGCGRGEILRHCAALGAAAFGVDYAPVALELSRQVLDGKAVALAGVAQSDAKRLPFPSGSCDRVLMFDVVEHLYPWELQAAFHEVRRVLHTDGLFVLHTAPNAWYDRFAYPLVRAMRRMGGTH